MAEINRHIQHVKSKVVENGKPKLPTESQLLDGEIAVNYAKDYETLSIKNESGDIVTFSSDNVFVEKYIEPNERVIAEALNDLNSRVGSISTDLDGKVDKVEGKGLSTEDYTTAEKTKLSGIEAEANKTVVDTALSETSENPVQNKAIYAVIKDNEEIVAEALNDLNSRVGGLNNVEASETNGNIKINDVETTVYELPTATSSVLGGVMVDAALNEQSNNVVANSAITKAIVDNERVISEALNDLEEKIDTHTADTEIHVTSADKTKLASIEEGATKIEVITGNGLTFNDSTKGLSLVVDIALSSASTNVVSNKAIYDVIKENEEITANALNDLDSRLATVSGDVIDNEQTTATALTDLDSRADALETTVNNLSYLEEVTYSGLVSLKANSGLTKGMLYRITDYVTTTTQSLTQSANHPFDVIVLATSESSLNENAWAIQHDGDTYFSTSNLNAWEIKYCLENDANRFAWADTTNGKGVIFYMKDEYNNECPYDFKNIMFNYSNVTVGDLALNGNYYTFSFSGQTIQDASIVCQTIDGGDNKVIGVHDNSIGLSTTYDVDISSNRLMFALGKNAFVAADLYQGNVFYGICGNKLGCGCHDNIFGEASINNFIGNYSFGNLFGNKCQYNTLGASCYNNNFGSDSSNNTLGTNCILNTFNGSSNITFGNQCSSINLSGGCENITIGNSCRTVTFGKSGSRNIIVENGNSNITINANESTLKNITILQGCSNKTITHSGTVPTTYRLSGSTMTEI